MEEEKDICKRIRESSTLHNRADWLFRDIHPNESEEWESVCWVKRYYNRKNVYHGSPHNVQVWDISVWRSKLQDVPMPYKVITGYNYHDFWRKYYSEDAWIVGDVTNLMATISEQEPTDLNWGEEVR